MLDFFKFLLLFFFCLFLICFFFFPIATRARYELQAEIMGMEFELQPRYGGGFLPFVRNNKSVFLRAYNDEFFTMTQRQVSR